MAKETLLSYLKRDNPTLWRFGNTSSSTTMTKSPGWRPPSIYPWDEFNYDTLQRMSGRLLYSILRKPLNKDLPQFSPIPAMFRTISDEDSLDSLLIKWTQSVVSEALAVVHEQHPAMNEFHARMARGGQASFFNLSSQRQRPDRAGVRLRSCDNDNDPDLRMPTVVLPGDTKLSEKWKSEKIPLGEIKESQSNDLGILPVMQIFRYCISANTRYGFLITDEELDCIRVRPNDQSKTGGVRTLGYRPEQQTKTAGYLQYKAIKWNTNDSDGLTVNLALWWIHLLAAHESKIDFSYSPLDEAMSSLSRNIHPSEDICLEEQTESRTNATQSPATMITDDDKFLHSFDSSGDPSTASVASSAIASARRGRSIKAENGSRIQKKRKEKLRGRSHGGDKVITFTFI
ncbi:MAG: hypothetical protein Q9157_001173 [Trypethelium eluteriae]